MAIYFTIFASLVAVNKAVQPYDAAPVRRKAANGKADMNVMETGVRRDEATAHEQVAAPVPGASKNGYVLGQSNTYCSASRLITSAADCKAAAEALGFSLNATCDDGGNGNGPNAEWWDTLGQCPGYSARRRTSGTVDHNWIPQGCDYIGARPGTSMQDRRRQLRFNTNTRITKNPDAYPICLTQYTVCRLDINDDTTFGGNDNPTCGADAKLPPHRRRTPVCPTKTKDLCKSECEGDDDCTGYEFGLNDASCTGGGCEGRCEKWSSPIGYLKETGNAKWSCNPKQGNPR